MKNSTTPQEYGNTHKQKMRGQSIEDSDLYDPKNTVIKNRKADNIPAISKPLTPIQLAAIELFDAGLNVLPIPRVGLEHGGKKPPYGKYYYLFTSRLLRAGLVRLFERSNLAVLCGRLSHNLFVLDCDEPHLFARIGWELEKCEISPWIVSSARGGHYWLLSGDGVVKNNNDPIPGLQVIGNRGYIVAPPSVHPTGLVYSWVNRNSDLPPIINLNSLGFIPSLTLISSKRGEFPPVAEHVLVNGEISDYATNSEAEFAAAMSLARAGFIVDEIISLFEQYQPSHFASKKNPSSWLRRYMLPKVFEYANAIPQSDAFTVWANSRPWPGRSGETDKRVFLALCYRARLDGRKSFRASVREIAEIANIAKDTARRSIARLIKLGLISFAGIEEKSKANLYSFNDCLSDRSYDTISL